MHIMIQHDYLIAKHPSVSYWIYLIHVHVHFLAPSFHCTD